jgi:hypothetical protein
MDIISLRLEEEMEFKCVYRFSAGTQNPNILQNIPFKRQNFISEGNSYHGIMKKNFRF